MLGFCRFGLLFAAIAVADASCTPPAGPSPVSNPASLEAGRDVEADAQEVKGSAAPAASESESAPWDAAAPDAAPADQVPDAIALVCPRGMVLVRGSYCPEPVHRCLGYLDPPGRYHEYRCREYDRQVTCASPRVALEFCIDAREYTRAGQSLPANFVSFLEANRLCQAAGKRLCRESEWNFACEGPEMLPYPYGFKRDATVCYADRTDILDDRKVRDLRAVSGSRPGCASPFGVFDMAGNLEELVALDGTDPPRPVMKGDWWHPGRNHCRARQTFHNSVYKGVETGFRCCADALADPR